MDWTKIEKGFATLFIGLVQHSPELAMAALAAYADVRAGNIPGAVVAGTQAASALTDLVNSVKAVNDATSTKAA